MATRSVTCNLMMSDMIRQPHLLIAGATGAGKSVLLHGLIYHLLGNPNHAQLVLVDPKRVELIDYANQPQTLLHVTEPTEIIHALEWCCRTMDDRYREMMQRNDPRTRKQYGEPPIYIIIDELADLMTTSKRQATPLLARLTQLGRAADVHVIAATQRPTRDLINGQIAVNIDARVALRCPTAQDSRNIIGVSGAETLPRHGELLYRSPEGLERYSWQPIPPEEIEGCCQWLIETARPAPDAQTGRSASDNPRPPRSTLSRGADLMDERPSFWRRPFGRG